MAKIRTILIVVLMLLSTMLAFVPAAPAEDEGAAAPMDIAPMGTQRVVLAELYTGAWCGHCPAANQALGMVEDNFDRDEVVNLAWHYGDNLAFTEGNERISWVGISGYPTAKFDGVLEEVGDGGGVNAVYNRYVGRINTRSAISTSLRMTTEWNYDDMTGDGEVWVNITAVETPTLTNLKLHTVVFENDYGPYNGGNGENYHNFVARDMLESEGSSGATVSITNGQTLPFHYTFDASPYAQDLEEIGVIAFVQSHNTKEVLQASYVGVPVLPNVPPVINSGQASPLSGDEDDDITFKVWYSDADDRKDQGPSEAKVFIKEGTNTPSSHDLIPVPSGEPWTVGKWVRYTTKLAPGTYTYRFFANDGEDDATGDIGWNATQITIVPRNKVPELSTQSFAPTDGDTTTLFRFDVMYQDLDNDEPTEAKIYIDDTGYDMQTDSIGPWNTWVTYYYETTLSVKSMYQYYFTFSDGEDSVRMPSATSSPNFFIGPEVVAPNNEPTLTEGKFSPDDGTRDTEFTFVIKYTDGENDHPTVSYVYIDDVPYIMTPDGSAYNVGVTFRYTTKLSMGGHNIHFVFNDGNDNEARFPMTGDIPGPVVTNMDPVAKIASPTDGVRYTPDDYITFSAVGTEDPEGDEITYKWTSSLQGELSTLEAFDMPLDEGEHTITLEVTDSYGGVHSTSVDITVKAYEPHSYVDHIAPNLASIVEGDRVKFTVTLMNDGEIQDSGVEIRFLVDNVQLSSDTMSIPLDTDTEKIFTWLSAEEGTHTITIEVGTESKDLTVEVAANTLPEVTASFVGAEGTQLEVKPGKDVYFDLVVSDANGDSVTYLWDFGDGITSDEAKPAHVYTTAGTYPVKVTVTDERGGSVTKELTVVVTKPKSSDESPGFGALLAATAFMAATLAVAVRRRR